jgi:outer membrane protein assembly factor BamB
MMTRRKLALIASCLIAAPLASAADWPTARGNAQRTGHVDGQPGPKSSKVLWVAESQTDHYLAAPSPGAKVVYAPALGTLNSGVLSAISSDAAAPGPTRLVWAKTQPSLKLPTVCSPAVIGDRLYFGDGMHQNESPTVYCLEAATGKTLWQIDFPGPLIHVEGTPTVLADRAIFGAGNGGVVCVSLDKLTLDGKDVDAAAIKASNDAKWKEMLAKYEADKKKDPDFAIKPSEDALPKPAPKVLWQQGVKVDGKTWHVDCPVAVAGDNVLAGSAYLKKENTGDCALFCMNADTGAIKWRAELKYNPWAGASISPAGDLAVVGCSDIRFDPKEIPQGKGEVVAVNLADGSVKWRKDVPAGGVVSPAAITGDLAIFTATDKKVRAVDLKTGADKWEFSAKTPFFAGVAVAGDTVYAADLNGVVYALSLADGKQAWKLDIGKATKALGNIYASPVVDGGRLYVATCNIDSPDAKKTVIVCIGEK